MKDINIAVTEINQQIDSIESAIRKSHSLEWSIHVTPVRDILIEMTKSCKRQDELIQPEMLKMAKIAQRTPKILSGKELLSILEAMVEHGLLSIRKHQSLDPLEGDIVIWSLSNHPVVDFLVSRELLKQ